MKWRGRLTRWPVAIGILAFGCGLFRGAVNASPSLRWWLFSHYGAERICPEMLKRGAPLRLVPQGNAIGRFFPRYCQHQINESQRLLTLQFSGTGYAWTPLAGRMGFAVDAAVEYRPDFQMTDDYVYIWAKTNRILSGPTFSIGSVENKLVDWATRTPIGYLASTFGGQVVESQLASGFTVLHGDNGDDFSLGILMPPQKPQHPFDLEDDDRLQLANETTEVHPGQVDFLGPFEVAESDQAMFVRFSVTGPSVDVLVYQRASVDPWRESIQQGAPLGPPPMPPATSFVVTSGKEQSQRLRVPRGSYYLVVDNSANMGSVAPAWNPMGVLGVGAAVVSYSVALGDAS